jgi:hypothetical protein
VPPPYASTKTKKQRAAIRAVLTGCDNCTALGLTTQSSSPVLLLCRRLITELYVRKAKPGLTWDTHQRGLALIAVLLLFVCGFLFARHAGLWPFTTGVIMVVIGAALVSVAIALGG